MLLERGHADVAVAVGVHLLQDLVDGLRPLQRRLQRRVARQVVVAQCLGVQQFTFNQKRA